MVRSRLTLWVFEAELLRMIFRPAFRTALLFTFSLASTLGFAADWAQWRGPERTGHAAKDAKLITTLPAEPKVLWRQRCGEGFASPVVAAGRAYLFDAQAGNETLRAFDALGGSEVWRADVDIAVGDTQGPAGPRCTPLVDGDRVYAQSMRGELQCLDVKKGKLVWRVNFTTNFGAIFIGEKGQAQGAARHGNDGSPVIEGEFLICQPGGTNGAGVACLNKKTGKVIWKSQNDQAGYAAPTIATIGGVKQVVCFTCDGLIGLDFKDGNLLWRVPMKTQFSRHVTTPVVVGDIVVAGSHTLGLIGTKVTKKGNEFATEQAWVTKEAAMNYSSPIAVGEHLYGLGPAKNVVCIEAKTGKVAWSQDGWFTSDKGKAVGYFIVLEKNILASTDGGQLILFAADPTQAKEISRVQVCSQTWAGPAYVDGKVFMRDGVKTGGELLCVDLLAK